LRAPFPALQAHNSAPPFSSPGFCPALFAFEPRLRPGTHAGTLMISPSSGTECPMVGAMPTSPEKPMSICCVTLSVPKLCRASADADVSALCCACSSSGELSEMLPMNTREYAISAEAEILDRNVDLGGRRKRRLRRRRDLRQDRLFGGPDGQRLLRALLLENGARVRQPWQLRRRHLRRRKDAEACGGNCRRDPPAFEHFPWRLWIPCPGSAHPSEAPLPAYAGRLGSHRFL
jgi:hypothetical protein